MEKQSQKKKVLFVCSLNAVRSVLAEYLCHHHFADCIDAQSCGVIAGPPDGYAASVALEQNIDITNHESRYLSDVDASEFDEIISFSEDAALEVAHLNLPSDCEILSWQVTSFAGLGQTRDEKLVIYRQVFEDIKSHLMAHFAS